IVILSAAGDRQQAFPILVNEQYHGAFSYLLLEAHRRYGEKHLGEKPKIQYLQDAVTKRMKDLQLSGELHGVQVPVFTTRPHLVLDDKPLFATWAEAPIIALVNPLSKINISLRTKEGKSTYRIGETISYEIDADSSGFLICLSSARRMWPRAFFRTAK